MGAPTIEKKYGPLGTFDPRAFSKAIQGLGLTFGWSRAVECPCRMEGSDTFDPGCSECGGDGWWYVSPMEGDKRYQSESNDSIDVQCAFGQANMSPSMVESFGQFTFADAIMTMQHEMRVSFRDRFVGSEQVMGWTELLHSLGTGSTIPVGKSGRGRDEQLASMRYEPLSINFIADEDKVRYYKGIDYKVLERTKSEPSKIQFLAGRGPATDKTYSVHYDCRPVWIVDDATYAVQSLKGPERGLKGELSARLLPTTFKVRLDFLTRAVGT